MVNFRKKIRKSNNRKRRRCLLHDKNDSSVMTEEDSDLPLNLEDIISSKNVNQVRDENCNIVVKGETNLPCEISPSQSSVCSDTPMQPDSFLSQSASSSADELLAYNELLTSQNSSSMDSSGQLRIETPESVVNQTVSVSGLSVAKNNQAPTVLEPVFERGVHSISTAAFTPELDINIGNSTYSYGRSNVASFGDSTTQKPSLISNSGQPSHGHQHINHSNMLCLGNANVRNLVIQNTIGPSSADSVSCDQHLQNYSYVSRDYMATMHKPTQSIPHRVIKPVPPIFKSQLVDVHYNRVLDEYDLPISLRIQHSPIAQPMPVYLGTSNNLASFPYTQQMVIKRKPVDLMQKGDAISLEKLPIVTDMRTPAVTTVKAPICAVETLMYLPEGTKVPIDLVKREIIEDPASPSFLIDQQATLPVDRTTALSSKNVKTLGYEINTSAVPRGSGAQRGSTKKDNDCFRVIQTPAVGKPVTLADTYFCK